jgi:hypothetical protein
VIPSQTLAELESILASTAVLTRVSIAREQEGVGYLTPELAWNMDESDEPDNGRLRNRDPRTTHHTPSVGLYDLRLAVENQPESTTNGNER